MVRNNHFLNSCRLDFLLKGRCSDNHFGFILKITCLQAAPASTDRENKETRIYCYKALICKSTFKAFAHFHALASSLWYFPESISISNSYALSFVFISLKEQSVEK